jgi:hypothetical protein
MRAPGKAIDPRINVYDMSSDAIGYADARMALIGDLLADLKNRATRDGDSYQELVNAYLVLLSEMNNQVTVVSRYVGGVQISRTTAGQAGAETPFVPVPAATQGRAMTVLAERLFAPDAFAGPADLYAYLQQQRRLFDFSSGPEDPKPHGWLLRIQGGALDHLLHPVVLRRITDSRLYGNDYSVQMLMEALSAAIFDADLRSNVSTLRQNLQLDYIERLSGILTGERSERFDHPARSMALFQLRASHSLLSGRRRGDVETQAHTENAIFRIDAALEQARNGA